MKNKSKHIKGIALSVLFIIIIVLIFIWIVSSPYRPMTWAYPDSQFYAASLLRGEVPFSEISQDVYGLKALFNRWDAYLPLNKALPEINENWNLPTTHPPTAFFFASPIVFFSNANGATIWAWGSIVFLILSLRLYDFNWKETLIFTFLSFLWLPTMGSLGQLTPIWLLGLSLAFYFRERNIFLAGVFVALAAMTKFLPVLLIIPFILKKKWTAIFSFLLTWVFATIILLVLSPDIFSQYFHANLMASPYFINKSGGLLFSLFTNYGYLGLFMATGFVLLIISTNWKEIFDSAEITPKTWFIFSYYAIALLPIAWGYSYYPLYPALIWLSKIKKPVRVFGIASLVSFSILPVVGMFLLGLGLAWPESFSLKLTKNQHVPSKNHPRLL